MLITKEQIKEIINNNKDKQITIVALPNSEIKNKINKTDNMLLSFTKKIIKEIKKGGK